MEGYIRLALAKPKTASGPVPVILKMDSCPFNESYQAAEHLNMTYHAFRGLLRKHGLKK